MEPGGEETAAKCAKPSPASEDRLSALPDDVLILILLRLRSLEAPHGLRDALAASAVPLRYLLVRGLQGAPTESIATWLPAAARRLVGELILDDMGPGRYAKGDGGGGESKERDALELPCFEKATSISLDLGFLGLFVPPARVFARLTELFLMGVWFHGELGGAVSSPRCPLFRRKETLP
ncbi:putative F-box/LRR-repeat protein [Panicum miliaceum]|uniref:F-box/LRR-repeat protein n=1 Tax=Panicum miliaceum TaxID=4540 RepID=A0A3L6QTI2_PANMI|nr:putative F-box/LRR-repeat protein [Panicum miliaceum]